MRRATLGAIEARISKDQQRLRERVTELEIENAKLKRELDRRPNRPTYLKAVASLEDEIERLNNEIERLRKIIYATPT
jgi:predicted nuclease with TOPRIM domain